jgi:hypothetical protein
MKRKCNHRVTSIGHFHGPIFLPQWRRGPVGCRSCSCRWAWRCPTCASSRTGWRGSPRKQKDPRWTACTSPHTAQKTTSRKLVTQKWQTRPYYREGLPCSLKTDTDRRLRHFRMPNSQGQTKRFQTAKFATQEMKLYKVPLDCVREKTKPRPRRLPSQKRKLAIGATQFPKTEAPQCSKWVSKRDFYTKAENSWQRAHLLARLDQGAGPEGLGHRHAEVGLALLRHDRTLILSCQSLSGYLRN